MRTFRIALLAVALGLAAAGCGSSSLAKISGKVTYKGTALKGGSIVFVTDKGTYAGTLGEDGSYVISDVPPGDAKVTVETESVNPEKHPSSYPGGRGAGIDKAYAEKMQRPGQGDLAQKYVKIPEKYGKTETSGLGATVKGGKQTHNFDLTD